MVYDNTNTIVKNFRIYLGNKIYFASQLCFDINEGLNSNSGDLSTGGIIVYSYDEATRTVEFKIKEGLNYKVKIPTDIELATYVGGSWDTGTVPYNSSNPVSIKLFVEQFCSIISINNLDKFISQSYNRLDIYSLLLILLQIITILLQIHIHQQSSRRCFVLNNWAG